MKLTNWSIQMTNSVSIFNADTAVVSYENKKGDSFTISTEGALFKGGIALRALKDTAMLSAAHKAENGKYRASADILSAAFPSMAKAFEKFIGLPTWQSKTTMALYLDKLEALDVPAKGWSKKQVEARGFIQALRQIKSLERAAESAFIVEA
jgi:hypothetical protein